MIIFKSVQMSSILLASVG